MTEIEDQVAERFARDVVSGWTDPAGSKVASPHELTILHDDGLYRHLRFRRPATQSSSYWFDLVTWPGRLTIDGDCGTWTFARVEDMFTFFRGDRINPAYWAEKLRLGHGDPHSTATGFSERKFRLAVNDEARAAEADWPGLTADIDERFFGEWSEYNFAEESDASRALAEYRYRVAGDDGRPFEFTDWWEMDLRDWDFWFLWCCHAIQWGIRQYDQAKVKVDA